MIASPATLAAVLAAAAPGSTVALSPGSYGPVSLRKPVTLTGPADAVLASLVIPARASGSTVEGISVRLTPTEATIKDTPVIRVSDATDVTLRGLTVRAGVSPGGPEAGRLVGRGINILRSIRVRVEGCDLAEMDDGFVLSGGEDVALIANTVHDTRGSPVCGSAPTRLTIARNHFRDVTPWNWGAGDHANMIHLWTMAGGGPVEGLTIRDNLMDQGQGVPVLGVYLDDRNLGIGFRGVVIDRNTILLGSHQALRLENVAGIVTGNLLLQASGDVKAAPTAVLAYGSAPVFAGNRMCDPRDLLALDATNDVVPPGAQPAEALALARWVWACNA